MNPDLDADSLAAPGTVEVLVPDPGWPSILMVDDHPARLLTYEAILNGLPVQFVRANSGEEALQLLLKQSFALILLDVNMPGLDGFEVARHVRGISRLNKIPIIFVSGERLSDLDRLKGYEVGAIDYIGVPIVPEILRSKVAVLIELFNRRAELERVNAAAIVARNSTVEQRHEDGAGFTHLRALFDQTPDIKFILRGERDAAGKLSVWRYVDANASALKLYKRTREEIVGRTVEETFPEHSARATALCQQALLGGERLQHETEFANRQLLVRMFAVDEECVAVTCTDITEFRELQEALTEADRRKDEFLAMLAHELRNPVAPILNVAQILSRHGSATQDLPGMVSIIHRQARHLARLLDDLFDVARITRNRIELRREVVQLDECVALALETVEPSIRSSQHTLEVERSSVELAINVDKDRLTQCITNLLNNAVKYSPPASRIRVRTFRQDEVAIVEVQDFGHGIRPEVMPHIFDLFAQGHDTLDRRNGGLGIGLSVCKRLIEMHGGTVTAHSAGEGRGATFALKVPLAATPPLDASPTLTSKAARKRVLVVDDNRDAADSVAMLLELSGHETQVVFQGRDALKSWKAFAADVVILDIGLPDLSGYEVVTRLRQEGFSGVAIALSGYGQPEDKRRALDSGFDLHFVKPMEGDALEKALAGICS